MMEELLGLLVMDYALMDETKACPVCKNSYPREHYKQKGGQASYCKKCWRDYCRKKQREHRARQFNKAGA